MYYIYIYIYIIYIYIYIYTYIIYIYIYIVCDHEITQDIQFAETSLQYSCIKRNLRNLIELLTVTSGL